MTDHERWEQYFLCNRIPQDIDVEILELTYQAFKARLIAEVVAKHIFSLDVDAEGNKIEPGMNYPLVDIGEQAE